jgi:diguanylate cyclase (GGDEF)-like protein
MTGSGREDAARVDELIRENDRLREEVRTVQAATAATLSRATRIAQVVSALVQLTDPQEILDRAASEVAEQFFCDIAAFLMPAPGTSGTSAPLALRSHWGIPDRSAPDTVEDPPAEVTGLAPAAPLAGPAEELTVPAWLRPSAPRHLAWVKLVVRGEHLGFLLLARRADEPFSPSDVRELGLITSRIALAVDNGRLYSRTLEQVRLLQRLHEVAASFAGALELEPVVESLATTLVEEVPVTGAAVYVGGKLGLEVAAEAGIVEAPVAVPDDVARTWPDDNLILMHMGGRTVGALLLNERPPAGSEADSFLKHMADLGSLSIGKSQLFARLRTQAESDPLTGLPNRTMLMGRLESAVSASRERGTDLAVVFVDLDAFKSVNDTYGHDVGDQLLIEVAGRLTDVAGKDDIVARLGGDEFVLMKIDTDIDEALAVAQEIRSTILEPHDLGGTIVFNKASVGVAMASASNYHPKTLMRNADAGMYADKLRVYQTRSGSTATTRSRPRERALPTAAQRRAMRSHRPPRASRAMTTAVAMAAENLRQWCDARTQRSGAGFKGAAGEAVHRILRIAREELDMDLTWLSHFVDGQQTFDAFEGDPGSFSLSVESGIALGETYCARVLDGRLRAVVPDTAADERTATLPVTREHRIGAYLGAPVFAQRGGLYGMLCAVSHEADPSLQSRDIKVLHMLAGMLAEPVALHLAREAQASTFARNAASMLEAGGLTVHLQPIVDLATGATISVEALARFASYPYSVEGWFAQAHEAGCGTELEIDAMLNACRLVDLLPEPLTLAVNASPDVACSSALLDVVTGAGPGRIVVEITEHRRASEPSMFASAIRRLKEYGAGVAIDDAGTGYSDLRQILEMQPDIIKLDRSLVDGVDVDPVKVALVQALVAFAEDTGISLVAEGISTTPIRDVLRELGVDCGQGYALGHPEPAEQVLERLRTTL